MISKKTFTFKATLSAMKVGFVSTVVFIPGPIIRQLPKGRVRTEGTLNAAPFALAIQFKKGGRRYFTVSRALRRLANVTAGNPVKVDFKIVDPDFLILPEELEAVLKQDEEAKTIWNTIPRGTQRGLVHYVTSVKNVDSRIRRALEIVQKARLRQLHFQKPGPKRKKP